MSKQKEARRSARRRFDPDATMAALAARQHGVLTRSQLRRAGVSDDIVDRRIRRGLLQPLHRGVFQCGPVTAPFAREMAACLACGPGARIGHASAAVMWQLLPPPAVAGDVEVVVTAGFHKRAGIRLHRVEDHHPDDIARLQRIPITRPSRVLLDIAGTAAARDVERALAQAFARRLATLWQLRRLLQRCPHQRGASLLRALLEIRPALTRSEAEERFLCAVRRAQLPAPEVNTRIAGFEVDFLWRTERLVAEIDGYSFHATSRAFENDRRRDLVLTSHGLRVVRLTWQQLTREPEAVIARVAQALVWGR